MVMAGLSTGYMFFITQNTAWWKAAENVWLDDVLAVVATDEWSLMSSMLSFTSGNTLCFTGCSGTSRYKQIEQSYVALKHTWTAEIHVTACNNLWSVSLLAVYYFHKTSLPAALCTSLLLLLLFPCIGLVITVCQQSHNRQERVHRGRLLFITYNRLADNVDLCVTSLSAATPC